MRKVKKKDKIFNLTYLTFIDITTPLWKITNNTMISRLLQFLFLPVIVIVLNYNSNDNTGTVVSIFSITI